MVRKRRRSSASADAETIFRRSNELMRRLTGEQRATLKDLPLRRDMIAILTYVRDNKVTGTQSTGNFLLKAVREITARFVNPPELDHTIGDHTYKLRSEDDVWPLQFLHTLAYLGGLLEDGPARRWHFTPMAARFLQVPHLIQVWLILATWWQQADWIMAYPFTGMGESLPRNFKQTTLEHLLALPVDADVPFEPFADKLIAETGLTWTSQDTSFHQMALREAIRRMVIGVLANFGALQPEYQEEALGEGTTMKKKNLVSFRVTPLGKGLLELM